MAKPMVCIRMQLQAVLVSAFLSRVAVKSKANFDELQNTVEKLTFCCQSCNDDDFVTLDLTRFRSLKEVHIKNGSLKNVKDLIIRGLDTLEQVNIEGGCFSDTESGAFEISKCRRLTKVKVGSKCFSSCRRTVFDGRAPFSL